MFISSSRQNQSLEGDENLLVIQVIVCHILKHKVGKRDMFILIVFSVKSFSFSTCTEQLGLRLVLL